MTRLLDSQVKAMVEQFVAEGCRFESVTRWRNTLRSKRYERYCLVDLAKFCIKFNINPDELVAERIQQSKSDDPRVRSQAEDKILAHHKELVQETPGKAICAYRRVKSFYRANYVALQCRDPSYTIQWEQDYLATKEETRKMCELLDLEAKTYLLVLAECCGRSGAVAQLAWADIREELNSDKLPAKIWLKHKVKVSRKKYFTFICADAKKSLQLFMENRTGLLPTTKVFSTGYSGLRKKVMNAAEKIGIYANGNGHTQAFRLHTYRKRGQTILEKAHVPLNWVDRILGHVPRGAQAQTYSLPDVESMREEYVLAMPELTVFAGEGGKVQSNMVSKEELYQILAQLMPNKAEEIKVLLD